MIPLDQLALIKNVSTVARVSILVSRLEALQPASGRGCLLSGPRLVIPHLRHGYR